MQEQPSNKPGALATALVCQNNLRALSTPQEQLLGWKAHDLQPDFL